MEIKIINNMLEQKVRQSLMEVKEQKETDLIKENLVKNRLLVLVEHIKIEDEFNRLSENKKSQLSFNVLQELSYLESNGLISEQDLGGALKSVFGGFFGNATQTFFEPILGKFIIPIFGEGFMSNFIISYLTSRPSDLIKAMSDCKLMTKLIAESVVEAMVMSLQRQKGFDAPGYSFLRNTLGGVIEGTEFVQGIETSLSSTVCGLFSKFTGNAEKVKSKLNAA
jgi:hypothetical protein